VKEQHGLGLFLRIHKTNQYLLSTIAFNRCLAAQLHCQFVGNGERQSVAPRSWHSPNANALDHISLTFVMEPVMALVMI